MAGPLLALRLPFPLRVDLPPFRPDLAAPIRTVASPIRLSKTPVRYDAPPPKLGQDTEMVLMDAGLDWDEISAYREAGALG